MHKSAFLLLAIGGLNWLLVGLFGWDIGAIFGGQGAFVSRLIYLLVGLSAVYELWKHRGMCKECMKGKSAPTPEAYPGM